MRVLVTGGAGFIGSHVVDELIRCGHQPVIFDTAASPWPEHRRVAFVRGSILEAAEIAAAAARCDAIMHLAAAADVGEVARDVPAAEELNARGTLNVLEAAREHGCRVVYASTIWVYSDTDGEVLDEDDPLSPPAHVYSATKLAGELYCRSYRELFDVRSTVLRFGIPYGPRARPAAVLPIFVRRALAGEPLTIAGDGLQTRRFVYVEDLAKGVVAALAEHATDRTYNLVGEEETSVRDIADTVRGVVGEVDIVHTEGRAGDFGGAVISGERARAELDWSPATPFSAGVRRYVDWHRAHQEGAVAETAPAAAPARAIGSLARRRRSLPVPRLSGGAPIVTSALVLLVFVLSLGALGVHGEHLGTVSAVATLLLATTAASAFVPSPRGLATGTVAALALLTFPAVAHRFDVAPLRLPLLLVAAIAAIGAFAAGAAAERVLREVALEDS